MLLWDFYVPACAAESIILADNVFRVRRRVQFFHGLAHGSVRLERQTHATRLSGKLGSETCTFTEKRSGARHLNPVARQHSHFSLPRRGHLVTEATRKLTFFDSCATARRTSST